LSSWVRIFDPVVITSGEYGGASISGLQLLWFASIILYLVFCSLFNRHGLSDLSPGLLSLLGISVSSNISSSVISSTRLRLSLENWNWLIDNGFLLKGSSVNPRKAAQWSDLVLTEGSFDPFRYQLLAFSIVFGLAILMGGVASLETFQLTPSYQALLFSSNVIYVGGKVLSPTVVKELDDLVEKLRVNEQEMISNSDQKFTVSDAEKHFLVLSLGSAYGPEALGSVSIEAINRRKGSSEKSQP
jgi:hypothetical protein